MAGLVARWRDQGRDIDLDALLVLSFLRENSFIDTSTAAQRLQLSRDEARAVLDQLTQPDREILERRGRTKAATYHLTKGLARDLFGKAAYTRTRGLDPIRYAEMVRAYLESHKSITPHECRDLLMLGESDSAKVEVSQHLRRWSEGDKAFLRAEGKGPSRRYFLCES
jgi:ATP-dependent DNA helicase RecG